MATKTRSVTVRTIRAPRRRSYRRGEGGGKRIPLAVVAGFAPAIVDSAGWFTSGQPVNGVKQFIADMTGYDAIYTHKFNANLLSRGLVPLLLGVVAHKLANRFGLNRAIRSAIPLIEI